MRTSDDDEPLVHRVRTDRDEKREAQMGLDVLLAKARVIQDRDARERAAKQSEEELEAVRQRRIRQAQILAARFEWRPVASVILFEDQVCRNCGRVHSLFRGFATLMERQSDSIKRLTAAQCLDPGLPFQRREIPSTAPCCAECLERFIVPPSEPSYTYVPLRSGD